MSDAADALIASAQRLDAQGQHREAIGEWMRAFQADPSRASSAIALAQSMTKLGQRAQAVELLGLAATMHPTNAELPSVRGTLLRALGRLDEALASHQQALALNPSSPAVRANLCAALLAAGRLEEALVQADAALALEPSGALLHFNRGTCLLRLGRLDEAQAALTRAVAFDANHADTWLNLGEVAVARGDDATAELHFRRALKTDEQHADAHFNLGLRLLARGEWAEGWREYAWREQIPSIPRRRVEGPKWTGAPLAGTLLVTAEQGLGDTLQFFRFVEAARARCARVVFECPPALRALLRGPDVVPQGEPLPTYDAQASLLDLPNVMGGLAPPPPSTLSVKPSSWARLPQRTVAIVWQGNPAYRADARRSVPLKHFERLAAIDGVRLVALQKHAGREQLETWPKSLPLVDLGATLDEKSRPFMETAQVLQSVDLVVASDTALPHLAGLLGRPVWLLLSRPADWRWGAEGETTPWYPTFRLFRQRTPGDWSDVFERVEAALRAWSSSSPAGP